jgi:hypothetical protein
MTEPQIRFSRLPVDDLWPITGRFGDVYRDGSREWTHLGVDFGCPTGTPVYAPAPGRVIRPNNDGSFGVAVAIEHSDGWITLYAHLSRADVWPGDEVQTGQQLGLSGATGFVTGSHLHWQMCDTWLFPRDPSRNRDPLLYLETEDPEMNARLERLERLVLMIGELLVGDSSGRQFVSLDELEPVLERHRANQTRFADGLGAAERELIQHRHSPVDGSVIWSGRF